MKLSIAQKDVLLDTFGNDKKIAALQDLIGFSGYIESDCSFDALEKSWNILLQTHDSLRIMVRHKTQIIVPYRYEELPREEVNGKTAFIELQKKMMKKPLPAGGRLWHVVLIDCGDSAGGIIVRLDHMCADGFSLEVLMQQLEKSYWAILAGESVSFKEISFTDSLKAERDYLDSPSFPKDVSWWRAEYRKQKKYSIPAGHPSKKLAVDMLHFQIEGSSYHSLKNLCAISGCSLPSALMTSVAVTTGYLTKQDNFALFNLCHGRNTWRERQMTGCLVKTIPVFYQLMPEKSFVELLKSDFKEYLECLRHGRVPFYVHILLSYYKSIRCGFCFQHNWFQFSYMQLGRIEKNSGIGLTMLENNLQRGIFYCAAGDIEEDGRVDIRLYYQTGKYTRAKVEKFVSQYKKILTWILNNPQIPISEMGTELNA